MKNCALFYMALKVTFLCSMVGYSDTHSKHETLRRNADKIVSYHEVFNEGDIWEFKLSTSRYGGEVYRPGPEWTVARVTLLPAEEISDNPIEFQCEEKYSFKRTVDPDPNVEDYYGVVVQGEITETCRTAGDPRGGNTIVTSIDDEFKYTLNNELMFEIKPATKTVCVNEWASFEAWTLAYTPELIPVKWTSNADASLGDVLFTETSVPTALTDSSAASSKIYFRTDVPGEYEVYGAIVSESGDETSDLVWETATVIILSVEFKTYAKTVPGPDKPHDLNLDTRQDEDAHYDPYSKCVSHIWSSDALDMAQYLDGYDDPDMRAIFHDVLKWQVNGSWQDSYELNLGSEPDSDEITRFNIGVACETGGDIQDYLIITVVPPSTQTDFNQWHTAEAADMGWLAELPALYSSLTFDAGGDPEDPEPGPCNLWNGPGALNSFYHPDGFFKMRSQKTAGDHGHQAIFQAQADGGGIIKTGVSAGSADREAPFPEQLNPFLHVNADVKPFVWAAQLDGNPVEESGTTMTEPMLHEGVYLGRYFQVRPAVANALPDLAPGTCP